MEKYELTVVTTTYNQENYIRECIDSILSQKTSFKFLLIVSNDNSTDDTKVILNEYQEKYPNKIRIINISTDSDDIRIIFSDESGL